MPTKLAGVLLGVVLALAGLGGADAARPLRARPAAAADDQAWPERVLCPKGKVIVIGAGVAGLTLTSRLSSYKCPVLVLEASSTVGGRVRTKRDLKVSRDGGASIVNGTVEMGAGWIHGSSSENPVYRFAHRQGIPTLYVGGDSTYIGGESSILMFGPDKKPLTPEKHLRLLKLYERYTAALEDEYARLGETDRDRPLCELSKRAVERINATDGEDALLMQWHFEVGYGGDSGTDACDLSALHAEDGLLLYPNGDSVFPRGYDEIPRTLAQNVDVLTNRFVTEVRYSKGDARSGEDDESRDSDPADSAQDGDSADEAGVEVVTADGEVFRGAVAVFTVSLGMLQSGQIKTNPPLPAWKQAAIRGLRMGVLNRYVFSFPKPFWPGPPQYTLGYVSNPPGEFPMMVSQLPITGSAVLELMVGGPRALELEALEDAEIKKRAMSLFEEMFPGKVPEPIDTLFTRHGQDLLSRGAYSHVPPLVDGVDLTARLERPLWDGRLLFAGEATDAQQRATVAGAMRSGEREARRVLQIFGSRRFHHHRHEQPQRALHVQD